MGDVVKLQRHSLDNVLEDLNEMGPDARGVIAIILKKDGGGHFRLSGFLSKCDSFTLCGLLDWVKADLMQDLLESAQSL